MAFLCVLKKQPEHLELAVWIIYFAYSTELAINNDDLVDATYHEPKRIGDRVHAVAMAWYHLKALLLGPLGIGLVIGEHCVLVISHTNKHKQGQSLRPNYVWLPERH